MQRLKSEPHCGLKTQYLRRSELVDSAVSFSIFDRQISWSGSGTNHHLRFLSQQKPCVQLHSIARGRRLRHHHLQSPQNASPLNFLSQACSMSLSLKDRNCFLNFRRLQNIQLVCDRNLAWLIRAKDLYNKNMIGKVMCSPSHHQPRVKLSSVQPENLVCGKLAGHPKVLHRF